MEPPPSQHPLHRLLCKNTIFKWTSKCEAAFLKMKQAIDSDQVLVPYDPDLPVQLACDASPTGIAGVLSHIVDGHEHPIAFASRSLTAAKQNYSQLDKEALDILTRIFNLRAALPKMTAGCLQRYAAFLPGFDYTIDFKKGSENSNVDFLSRAPSDINSYTAGAINNEVKQFCDATIEQIIVPTVTYQLLKEETKKDAALSTIMKSLQDENTSEPDIIESVILFHGQQVVVPATLWSAFLNELHRTHVGITKMKQLAHRYVYLQKIDSDIGHLVLHCSECVTIKNSPAKAPSHPWDEPEQNWQRIHIDYTSPYQDHHFLIVVDATSKWTEIVPCLSAHTTKNGFPEVMASDNATIFTSEEFAQFCKEAGIFQKLCAAIHPVTNGLVEHNVQTLKHLLATMTNQNMPIHQKVREILFRYWATPLSNGKSPAEQYLNRQIRIQLDAMRLIKFHESPAPTQQACQFSEGELELDNSFHFKRHIGQPQSTEVSLPARKTVHFDPPPKSPISDDRQLNNPNLGDLTEIMDPDVVLPEAEQPDTIEQEEDVPVVDFQLLEQPAQREHLQRERRLSAYLRDYSLY
ncbi:hypothetical protein PR048_027659 [Dryococelus australis]|uniref:RNA-directed DNA polymerase n=1 Tax=Dryococelus australis TaxID=614101 RepID=A0ABQ9GH47_9NEOP|nr:hypothetical protein PR048_027659 [Dryococelus australis]